MAKTARKKVSTVSKKTGSDQTHTPITSKKVSGKKSAAIPPETGKKAKPEQKQRATTRLEAKKMGAEGNGEGDLNAKQAMFADEYLIDFNATQAAIRAGYSAKTAAVQGFGLLRKPNIQAIISAKQKELAHKAGITRERIIAEAGRLAFSDIRNIFDKDGNLKAIHELDDATAAAISGVELVVSGNGDDVTMTKKIKLWDKNSALDKLLKHLGIEDTNPTDPVAALLAAIGGNSKLVPLDK